MSADLLYMKNYDEMRNWAAQSAAQKVFQSVGYLDFLRDDV